MLMNIPLHGKEVELTVEVNKKRVLIGERITLKVTLTSQERSYRLPILNGKLGDFLIQDYHLVKPQMTGGTGVDTYSESIAYTLVGYATGNKKIPELKFDYGNGVAISSPIIIEVESVLTPGDTVLEPLKPTLDNRGDLVWWAVPVTIVLLLIFILVLKLIITLLLRRRRLNFYDVALMQLQKIKKEIKVTGIHKGLFFKIDQLFKRFYSEYRDNPMMLSMTTKQMFNYLQKNSDRYSEFFTDFFIQAETIKFSSAQPEPDTITEQLRMFENIVKEIKELDREEKKQNRKKLIPSSASG